MGSHELLCANYKSIHLLQIRVKITCTGSIMLHKAYAAHIQQYKTSDTIDKRDKWPHIYLSSSFLFSSRITLSVTWSLSRDVRTDFTALFFSTIAV